MSGLHRIDVSRVTFLFTDIEGSTALWEQDGARMSQALAAHDALARGAVEGHHGRVVKMIGDGMHAVFDDAIDALAATIDLQQALARPDATYGVSLRVRCGLHAGAVERRDNDYFGNTVNRAARIMSAAHGGQVLLSQVVTDGVRETLPGGVSLRDLGTVRLRDLSTPEHIYQVLHPQLRQEFPPLRSLEATPNNLPQQMTSFVGRESEIGELKRLLAGTRILTLTGSGGCGKSRLALQVAADSLEQFPDGIWLVELASIADPEIVPQTVAKVLSLKEERGEPIVGTLTEFLKDKRTLLLIDNCEHLIDACAKVSDLFVRRCLDVKMLATSREALNIDGEQTYRVPSLSLPESRKTHTLASVARFDALRLFTERAVLARPQFEVTDQNASSLVSICRRLDGIPLAIELAAARVRSLSMEEIDAKLDQRFRFLTGGSRTALPRQQTLRALIDWSYDLLGDSEKLLLQRLSVFAGGWTLAAAEQVCAGAGVERQQVFDLLISLVDKSVAMAELKDEHSRYRLLETVRQYAQEKLLQTGGAEKTRGLHLEYFLAQALEAQPRLKGAEQAACLRSLEVEQENLRAALEWSLTETKPEVALKLCAALHRFWWALGFLWEGRDWCVRALGRPGADKPTPERANALSVAGVLAYHQNDYPAAQTLDEEGLAIRRRLGDRKGIAASLNNLGLLAGDQGNFPAARVLYEESLAIKRELGDNAGIANSLNNLGNVAYDHADFAYARTLYEESLAIARELGDREGIARLLGNLGNVAMHQHDLEAAQRLHEESLAIKRELGHRQRIASSLTSLGALASDQGRFASAQPLYEEALSIGCELGDRQAIATSLEGLATLVSKLDSPVRAARLWGYASHVRAEVGLPLAPKDRPKHEQCLAEARAILGDDSAFDRALQEGSALTLEQATGIAVGLFPDNKRPRQTMAR